MDIDNKYITMAYSFLTRLYNANVKTFTTMPAPTNISEISVLGCLATAKDPQTSGDIANKLQMKTARIAAILKSLEKKNLIRRNHSKEDRRVTLVSLTDSGRAECNKTIGTIVENVAMLYEKIGEEEMNQFLSTLLKISQYKEAMKC